MYLENGRIFMSTSFTGLPPSEDDLSLYLRYLIIDNAGNLHELLALDDEDAVDYIKANFRDFIYKVLSSDPIMVIRPNGYILAHVDTASGSCSTFSMSHWCPDFNLGVCFI